METFHSEMKDFIAYVFTVNDVPVCAIQTMVGSAAIAMQIDWLYGKCVEAIVCCGSCGVLDEIPTEHVILPTRALRNEGANYHYLVQSLYQAGRSLIKRPALNVGRAGLRTLSTAKRKP